MPRGGSTERAIDDRHERTRRPPSRFDADGVPSKVKGRRRPVQRWRGDSQPGRSCDVGLEARAAADFRSTINRYKRDTVIVRSAAMMQ